jgi:hypothetical protein
VRNARGELHLPVEEDRLMTVENKRAETRSKLKLALRGGMIAFLLSPQLFAQAVVRGRVTDQTGGAVVGIPVSLRSVAAEAPEPQIVSTDAFGDFRFTALTDGSQTPPAKRVA